MGCCRIAFVATQVLFIHLVQSQSEDTKLCVNDKEFTFHTQISTFEEANKYCKAKGRSLLMIKNSLIQGIIRSQLASLEKSFRSPTNVSSFGYWLGGTRKAGEEWFWVDDTPIPHKTDHNKSEYSNWLQVRPIPRTSLTTVGRGSCLLFVTLSNGRPSPLFNRNWQADNCRSRKYFICQKDISQRTCLDANTQKNLSTFSRVLLFFCVLFLVIVLVMGFKILHLNRRVKAMKAKRIENVSAAQAFRMRNKTLQNDTFLARPIVNDHPTINGLPYVNMDVDNSNPSYIELNDPNPIRPKTHHHATRTFS